MANFNGTVGNDGPALYIGGAEADMFDMRQGGNDNVDGGAGNDTFYFGGALTAEDVVNGGANNDTLILDGNYSTATTLTGVSNVETLKLLSASNSSFDSSDSGSFSYNLKAANGNVGIGGKMILDASELVNGETFIFDGSAETDGSFTFYAGAGTDVLTGSANNDGFLFRSGTYAVGDVLAGGGGSNDQIAFRGDFAGENKILIVEDSLESIEALVLLSSTDARFGSPSQTPFNYQIEFGNNNVTAGTVFVVDAAQLRANENLGFDAFASEVGRFRITGGLGNDAIVGGTGDDVIRGNMGKDQMSGAEGGDTFVYRSAAESTGIGFDTLILFDKREDKVDLPTQVAAFNGSVEVGVLNQNTFDSDLAAAVDATLQSRGLVLFIPDSGFFADRIFAVIDGNGDGNYTVGADYVVELETPAFPLDQNVDFFI
jgi:Ca2+-binding RTX toxin-like protein